MTDRQKLNLIILLTRNALVFNDKRDGLLATLDDILLIAEYKEGDE